MKRALAAVVLCSFVVALAACGKETTGDKVDNAIDKANDKAAELKK